MSLIPSWWPLRKRNAIEVAADAARRGELVEHEYRSGTANPAGWLIDSLSGAFGSTFSGNKISVASALGHTAVYGAIKILSEDVGKIPCRLMDVTYGPAGQPLTMAVNHTHWLARLLANPNPWMTPMEFWRWCLVSLNTHGNAFFFVPWDERGTANRLLPIHPDYITPMLDNEGGLWWQISHSETFEMKQLPTNELYIPDEYMLQFRCFGSSTIMGISPITAARNAIDMGMSLEKHGASLFGRGARPGGVLETEGKMAAPERQRLKEQWDAIYNAPGGMGGTAILWSGVKWKPMTVTSTDAQFIENRKFQVVDIARVFRIPPTMLQDWSDGHYSNLAEGNVAYIRDTLVPWCTLIKQTLEKFFGLGPTQRRGDLLINHDMEVLLQGDLAAEGEYYANARAKGCWITSNEIRRKKGQNPLPGGDELWAPANMIPARDLGKQFEQPPPAAPEPPADDEADPDTDEEPTEEEQMLFLQTVRKNLQVA